MGIATKGKRKIVVNNENYFWWVNDDYDPDTGHSFLTTIASEDKRFLVKYYVDQRHNAPSITVYGPRFPRQVETNGDQKISCPKFNESFSITPQNIRSIINWCLGNVGEKEDSV